LGPRRMQFLLEEGAALVLDSTRGDGGTLFIQSATVAQAPGTAAARVAAYAKEAEKRILPQVGVSVEHYNRLVRMVQAGEKVQMAVEMENRYHDGDGMAYNTIAEIPGTDRAAEIVMCGGHLDSWHGGTGATDNGAGVAVCMEAMRILKTLGVQPRRTIRIGLWSGEEQGIFGSSAYVREHFGTAAEPKPEHGNFSAYFNLDNGTGKIRGVYAQGNEAIMPIFAAWLKPFNDLGATIVTVRNTGGTDHLPFDRAGLPGFQFVQDGIEYDSRTHHSNQDVYDRIQVEDMKQAAVIMAAFLYNAAMRDEKLPRKPAPAVAANP
jgi:carboxypeptidase Q